MIFLLAPTVIFNYELTDTASLSLTAQNFSWAGLSCYPQLEGDPPSPVLPYALIRYNNVAVEQVSGIEDVYVLPDVPLTTNLSAIDLASRTALFAAMDARGIDHSAVSIDQDTLMDIVGYIGTSIDPTFDLGAFTDD